MKDSHDPNVTLSIEEDIKYFPCPVCGELKVLEQSKRGKPYLTCNDCGVQLFVRGKEGIKRIAEQFPDCSIVGKSKQKITVLDQYIELQKKLVEIREEKPIFWNNKHLDIAEKRIRKEIERITNYLD